MSPQFQPLCHVTPALLGEPWVSETYKVPRRTWGCGWDEELGLNRVVREDFSEEVTFVLRQGDNIEVITQRSWGRAFLAGKLVTTKALRLK